MMTVVDKLNSLFGNKEFLTKNAEKETIEELYAVVSAEYPEITFEEMKEYLVLVSKSMDNTELSTEDLDEVSGGGITVLGACAVIAGVGAGVAVFYNGGRAIGKAIYYLTH